jgi:hypothetical protein
MDDEQLMRDIRHALTPMPVVNPRAIANILSAVADRRVTLAGRWRARIVFALEHVRYATSPLTRMTVLAAVCVVAGFIGRGFVMRDAVLRVPASSVASAPPLVPAIPSPNAAPTGASPVVTQTVNDTGDPAVALVSVQFVLDARVAANATTVSVVGDFNEWNIAATPMTLERGAWSVSLPTTQGRHVYAFVINGERWIADPRAPRATDTDFGRPGSVIIVQLP